MGTSLPNLFVTFSSPKVRLRQAEAERNRSPPAPREADLDGALEGGAIFLDRKWWAKHEGLWFYHAKNGEVTTGKC